MSSFCSLLRQRGAVTLADIDAATENQARFGGDLGTNLIEIGAIRENALQRLLSSFHELPVGPVGTLPQPDEDLERLLPPATARRFRVMPVKRTPRTLHVAISEPLAPDTEKELRSAVGLQLRPVLVAPIRLIEALSVYCGMGLPAQHARVLDKLDESRKVSSEEAIPPPPASPSYRRMSERSVGIKALGQQPSESSPEHDTLDGLGPESASMPEPIEPTPPERARAAAPPSFSPLRQSLARDATPASTRSNHDTERLRDDTEDDDFLDDEDPPMSIGTAFQQSLPESVDKSYHFRHRGPFTPQQARRAASLARDISVVLEVTARFAQQYFERMILLTVSGDRAEARIVHAIKGSLAVLEVDLSKPSLFQRARNDAQLVIDGLGHQGVDQLLRDQLGLGDAAAPVAVVPIAIRSRVVALIFGTDSKEGVDPAAVEEVVQFADLASLEIARIILARKSVT